MDLKAKYLSDTCSDPIDFLYQLRLTTEPIGGSTVYHEEGELVEYDVAIEAVKKANDTFIEKAVRFLKEWDAYRVCLEGHKDWFIEQFKNYMKGE